MLLRCHFFLGWSVSVGISLKKSVFGVGVLLSIMYSKCCYQRGARYCTYARPSEQSSPAYTVSGGG